MFIIYDLIILVFALIYLPVYLFKKKFHSGFLARLGILPPGLDLNQPIWIHAVSVGEAAAAKNLAKELKVSYPDKGIFITTVTPTGNSIAKGIAKENDFVSYSPLDLSFIVRCVVDKIKPALFIIMETEIWPNLISYLYRKNIPVVLVNGRISDRSFKGYLLIKFLLTPVLNKISLFCVQTRSDAERLIRLGADENKIQVTGNMKFDNVDYTEKDIAAVADKYRGLLALSREDKLWVAGSTHPGEEEIILEVYKELLNEFPNLRLVIAPRHPQRASGIVDTVLKFKLPVALVSGLPLKPCACNSKPVFILDTIGQLIYFYSLANIVFVGGSLVRKGGHNILEPASLAKPVISGPHMFNFRDISGLFLQNNACIIVHNAEKLFLSMVNLLNNPDKITTLGEAAKAVVLQNRGATNKNLDYINHYLKRGEI